MIPRRMSKLFMTRRFKSTKVTITRAAMQSASAVSIEPPRLRDLKEQLVDTGSKTLDDFILESIQKPSISSEPSRFELDNYYHDLRKPVMQASTINPESYQSPEYFKVEQEKVFAQSWQVVGFTSQLKQHGDTIVATAAGQPIIVTKGKDKVIRGFFNACRHRGARLLSKDGRYPVISCPYHRWGYALDGRLLATPMWKGDGVSEAEGVDYSKEAEPSAALKKAFSTQEVENFNKKDYGLLPVNVATWGPFVYANVNGNAPPIETYLGDLMQPVEEYPFDDLVSYRKTSVDVNANWKLLAENFMEYYHLPAVHPELCDVSGVDQHERAQGKGMYVGFVTYPLTRGGTPLDPDILPAMEGITGKNKETAWFHTHFPNAFYFLFPTGLFTVILEPTGPNSTREHCNLLIHPNVLEAEDAEKKLQEMWDFYDMTNNQDVRICKEVQIGIGAKAYKGGRMTYRFEETIHRFQNMVADYMTGNSSHIPSGDESPPHPFQL